MDRTESSRGDPQIAWTAQVLGDHEVSAFLPKFKAEDTPCTTELPSFTFETDVCSSSTAPQCCIWVCYDGSGHLEVSRWLNCHSPICLGNAAIADIFESHSTATGFSLKVVHIDCLVWEWSCRWKWEFSLAALNKNRKKLRMKRKCLFVGGT